MSRYEAIVAAHQTRHHELLELTHEDHESRWADRPYRVADRATGMPTRHQENDK